jgi:hypothetical protein
MLELMEMVFIVQLIMETVGLNQHHILQTSFMLFQLMQMETYMQAVGKLEYLQLISVQILGCQLVSVALE